MTPRALHIQNESSGPARLFVEELEGRGFEVVTIDPRLDRLPESPDGFAAILSGGGTADTHQTDEHPWLIHEVALLRRAIEAGVPTMGLCLGAQLLTEAAGGTVYRCDPPRWAGSRSRPGPRRPATLSWARSRRGSWPCNGTSTRASSRGRPPSWPEGGLCAGPADR